MLNRHSQPKEAEECYRRAVGLIEKLVADYPEEFFDRHEQQPSTADSGALLRDTGRAQEAENGYRPAVAIHEKPVAEFPTVDGYRRVCPPTWVHWPRICFSRANTPRRRRSPRRWLTLCPRTPAGTKKPSCS